ncbi:NAD-dependent epimerase/dehydratase family protein [Candidatus Magnetomonas plexicatena]|uniref:NAD-dependent epimerase/dehydratase family protein n=1 Tax=Candidatus Magnetomonas plexicatena TaxID=2552947 RepID=UPI001C76D350|nr:NAD(P)-dependent oxidoreductase [Nitrospirales bacterium LBB_01]
MNKRVIITGATGFVGANLTRALLKQGHDVHLFLRQNFNSWRIDSITNDVHIHEVELSNEEQLTQKMKEIKSDWIFHLAVHGAYSWQTDLYKIIETNITGTVALVCAAVKTGFEAFINTGSSSEYGYKSDAPKETDCPEPNSYYAVAKTSATMFCAYMAKQHKVNISTLRLYSAYGPFEEPNRLIPTLIINGLHGKLPQLVRPDISRDYIYIDDITDLYTLIATKHTSELGAIYNVGTGVQTTLREIVEIIRAMFKIKELPVWGSMPERLWDTDIWRCDNSKIQETFLWTPRYSLKEGLNITKEWLETDEYLSKYESRG